MVKEYRLDQVLDTIKNSDHPVSGSELAKKFNVSRQVIVQDIALLRARDIDIVSTHKGYVIFQDKFQREIKVFHDVNMMEKELNTIVDLGGKIENVFVRHDVYGVLEAKLDISSRRDVNAFIQKISNKEAKPLTELTQGYHSHIVSASSLDVLDEIESALDKLNILYH